MAMHKSCDDVMVTIQGLYMNYPKSIRLYIMLGNSKTAKKEKKKKKFGAIEQKIAVIYAFSTISRHSIC